MGELKGTKIKIIGVGGAGGNALNDMIEKQIEGVRYVCINTDEQDIEKNNAEEKIALAKLGAGANPEVGRETAEKSIKEIQRVVEDQDMIFITAGMGGGTGTGASPVIAKAAKESGALTVAIVTRPFKFEGKKRENNAKQGLEELSKYVDTLIVIPNQKLCEIEGAKTLSFSEHFKKSNELLYFGIKSIAELITKRGLINLDFSDVKSVMEDSGLALFGFAESMPDEEVEDLVQRTITNPLLEKDIKGATKILINVTAGSNISLDAGSRIGEEVSLKASGTIDGVENLIFGFIEEPGRQNIALSIIATAFESEKPEKEILEDEKEMAEGLFETKEEEQELFIPMFL